MSIADTRAFFGDSFPAKIRLTGASSWQNTTFAFEYSTSSVSVQNINLAQNFFANNSAAFAEYDILVYSCTALGTEAHDLLIDLPMYFPDYAIGAFAVTNRFDGWSWSGITQSANVISTHPDNYYSDFNAIAAQEPSSVYGAFLYDPENSFMTWRLYPYQCDSDGTYFETLSVQSVQAYYSGRYELQLMIFCPHVGTTPEHGEPVVTTTATTTSPSGSDVDLTETNGLLGRILAALQGIAQSILDGIKGLFIPDDDFMDGFKDDMSDLLEDHLGGLYEAEQIMVNAFGRFPEVAAKSEIYIPPATLNLAGTAFTVGDWHVPLKVSGIPAVLYDGIAFIIDFLCLAAFLRMCRNKLEIFLNPDSEVVKE